MTDTVVGVWKSHALGLLLTAHRGQEGLIFFLHECFGRKGGIDFQFKHWADIGCS